MSAKLDTLTAKYVLLSRNSIQKRIGLAHRIGCLRYALGSPPGLIRVAFHEAAVPIGQLTLQHSIQPSLAIACWGIASIAGNVEALENLSNLDADRLQSQAGVPRYDRMLSHLYRAIQSLRRGVARGVDDELAAFEKILKGKRVARDSGPWAISLARLIAGCNEPGGIDAAIAARAQYLDDSYRTADDLLDHEGLLDVHGLGVLAAAQLGGHVPTLATTGLPTGLIGRGRT